ncbi:MAG: RNA 2',3'-cyclic phosphodiesterase [Gemmatimonadales bacterium]
MRLFVALNFPDSVRHPLWDALGPLRERGLPVKWVRPECIHLSLKFLGDMEEAREPELQAALRQATSGARGIPVHIEGFGVFPDFDRPRVIWAGVEPDPALELLQHAVERAFEPLGFATEARAFRPHVTVGRTRRARPGEFRGLGSAIDALAFTATTLVNGVDLVQSTLGPDGPVYQVRQRERLP